MSYTVCWSTKNNITKKEKDEAFKLVNEFVYSYTQARRKTPESLSGNSAHKERLIDHIQFNGKQDQRYEPFVITSLPLKATDTTFCKTDRKNYTLPVLVSLMLLKYVLKGKFSYTTDDGVDSDDPLTHIKCEWKDEKHKIFNDFLESKGLSTISLKKDQNVDISKIMNKMFN